MLLRLHCFSDVSNNFWILVQEKVVTYVVSITQRNRPIIPEHSSILFTTYYPQN